MDNIRLGLWMQAQIPDKDAEAVISLRDNLHEQLSSRMAVELDSAILRAIQRRLGVTEVDIQGLIGRLHRHIIRGSEVETYLLDGRPLLRVYPLELTSAGTFVSARRVFEELEG